VSLYDEIIGKVGMLVNGISFDIDIVAQCVLRCKSCAVGSFTQKRPQNYMGIEMFRDILDKAQSECKIRELQLYQFTDSAQHPDLHLFVQECTDRGIHSKLSTMLQRTSCDWHKVIEARPSELRISFPGWEKMTYYQGGAQPEEFDRNMEFMMTLPRYPETFWCSAFHRYRTNLHEEPRAEAWARERNLKLVKIPAINMVLEKTVRKNYTAKDEEIMSHMYERPEQAAARMKPKNYCVNFKRVAIDSHGMTRLCQLTFLDEFRLAPFLDTPLSELQKMQKTHPFCGECMLANAHRIQECFSSFDIDGDPIAEADRKRRLDPSYSPLDNLK
jgi:hypothetical protein